MLKALYDYGIRHKLVLPAGYVNKTVKAYLTFSSESGFIGVYAGGDEAVPCPDIGSLANSKDKSNILVEKRSVVIPEEPTPKSTFFLDTLRAAAQAEPLLEICVSALEDPDISAAIRRELDKIKVKQSERISFRVNGKSVLESEKILQWWHGYRTLFAKGDNTPTTLCLITGEPAVPMITTTPIQGLRLVGGHSRGDALICFYEPAFCSYDLKKAANAPVSEEAFAAVKAALDELLRDAPILAGMKFVHWFDREISVEDDPLYTEDFGIRFAGDPEDESDGPVNELAERKKANTVPESVHSGETVKDLSQVSYYILLMSGVTGRVMIRRYERGNYAELRKSLDLWRSDLALINPSGNDNIKSCTLTRRLSKLLSPEKKSDRKLSERLKKELAGTTPAIINSILTGSCLPDSVAAKTLVFIRSELLADDETPPGRQISLPDPLACQWLKVWLLRKNRNENREVPLMEKYNMSLDNSAYHCGGLMAVYAAIQKTAMPDVNAGIVERYYASAIQMPALVIGQLSSRSNHHLEKIENGKLADYFREELQAVATVLGSSIPATLNLEQQSYFALGYYQMGAKLNQEKEERIAAAKQRKDTNC